MKLSVEHGLGSVSQACRAVNLNRSSYYLESKMSCENRRLRKRIIEVSQSHPRYGYRRVAAMLRRDDEEVNTKRV